MKIFLKWLVQIPFFGCDPCNNQMIRWKSVPTLGLDLNKSTISGMGVEMIKKWGLRHTFSELFPKLEPVATCDKLTKDNIPIDRIWVLPGVNLSRGSMLEFRPLSEIKSDH